jgi:hypothetical protein
MASKFCVVEFSVSPEGDSFQRVIKHNLSYAVAHKYAGTLNESQSLATNEIRSYVAIEQTKGFWVTIDETTRLPIGRTEATQRVSTCSPLN